LKETISDHQKVWQFNITYCIKRTFTKQKSLPNPFSKLSCVWNGGTEHDDISMFGQHDQHLLPNNSSLTQENTNRKVQTYTASKQQESF